jgi:hypothetical protein
VLKLFDLQHSIQDNKMIGNEKKILHNTAMQKFYARKGAEGDLHVLASAHYLMAVELKERAIT